MGVSRLSSRGIILQLSKHLIVDNIAKDYMLELLTFFF